MSVLNHLAQAAAVILLVELLVILLIFLAFSGGLAFGLWWARGKTSVVFSKGNEAVKKASGYASRACGAAAAPFIKISSLTENVKATARSIRDSIRQARGRGAQSVVRQSIATEHSETTESIEPVPLV